MRIAVALLAVALAVAAAVFLAEHPGHVEIVWQDWQIDTSIGVLLAGAVLTFIALGLVLTAIAALLRLPRRLRAARAARRRRLGERALTRGMVALAAGDPPDALRQAHRAEQYLGEAPLVLLLSAQAAQLCRDETTARRALTAMLEQPELAFAGLRGLLGEAVRAGDLLTALALAERARLLRPSAAWLDEALLALETRAGRWEAAARTLAGMARRGTVAADRARHHRGVILDALSRAAERGGDLRRAARLAGKAQALAPDLAAVTCRYAELLASLGRRRAAARAIERSWRIAPHPELAGAYGALRPDEAPLARFGRYEKLAAQKPDDPESHLTIADAALAAQLWGEARQHLGRAAGSMGAAPSRRLCLTMARLERAEHGDSAAAREWLDKAAAAPSEPRYLCARCGGDSLQWQALCPHCGGFDTLAWRSPQPQSAAVGPPAVPPLAAILPALSAPEPLGEHRAIG